MKKNIAALTYAEILTVVLIIGLVSSFGMVSFFDFLKGREINSVIDMFGTRINEYDRKINGNQIFDYKISISTNYQDSFLVYENLLDKDVNTLLNYNSNGESTIYRSDTSNSDEIEIYIFENGKLYKTDSMNSNEYLFSFQKEKEFKIQSYQVKDDGKYILNDIELLRIDRNKYAVSLISINGNSNSVLEIVNVLGNKTYLLDGAEINNSSIKLTFEKEGKEKDLVINIK